MSLGESSAGASRLGISWIEMPSCAISAPGTPAFGAVATGAGELSRRLGQWVEFVRAVTTVIGGGQAGR